jgi:hypothetical protein
VFAIAINCSVCRVSAIASGPILFYYFAISKSSSFSHLDGLKTLSFLWLKQISKTCFDRSLLARSSIDAHIVYAGIIQSLYQDLQKDRVISLKEVFGNYNFKGSLPNNSQLNQVFFLMLD